MPRYRVRVGEPIRRWIFLDVDAPNEEEAKKAALLQSRQERYGWQEDDAEFDERFTPEGADDECVELTLCTLCGKWTDDLIGLPDGGEVCYDCFNARHG